MTEFWQTDIHKQLCNSAEKAIVNFLFDATRSLLGEHEMHLLEELYEKMQIPKKIQQMFDGEIINSVENRAVGHVACRGHPFISGKNDYTGEVKDIMERIYEFSDKVRNSEIVGFTGKKLCNFLIIGIGGSCLGLEFIHEALKTNSKYKKLAEGNLIHLLSNVDPIDIERQLTNLNLESTLVIIISKTFTTAETMLNSKTIKKIFINHFNEDINCVKYHFCAISTAVDLCEKFGIEKNKIFGFWNWVGGRFSVSSPVGMLPLALQYSKEAVIEFHKGALNMDYNILNNGINSVAAKMAMISFYNSTYLDYPEVAIIPYCQALCRFPAHIQQLLMESNGKSVTIDGKPLPTLKYSCEIFFGEPGTNAQHSFFQLIHQGRIIPCEFLAFTKSQCPIKVDSYPITNHDELMCNFFAQADALVYGRTVSELKAQNVPENLIAHKQFSGNRPSMLLLFKGELNPYRIGQILSIYEHRTVIEGWLRNINSFDQWGVELGKELATKFRKIIGHCRNSNSNIIKDNTLCANTYNMIRYYLENSDK